jgi:4-hydroxy-2-oxoheptanedioate aldolase
MQTANRLQKALRSGSGLAFGAWQMLPGTNHCRAIARCGYDWICVDTEHGNIDGSTTHLEPIETLSCHQKLTY